MKLYCIGIGPGGEEQMTLRAVRALEKCDCVAGYGLYLDLIENPHFEGQGAHRIRHDTRGFALQSGG